MSAEQDGGGTNGVYAGDCAFTEFLLKKAASRSKGEGQAGCSREECLARAAKLRLLLLDVDGVLTDGSITYNHEGEEIKSFNSMDGFGLNLLRKAGVEVGIISARGSKALERRCRDLAITHLYQGVRNKVEAWRGILTELDLAPEATGFIGDDWLDLSLLRRVGFAATVANGVAEVKGIAHFIAPRRGGHGGVRDVCDLIIEAHGKRQLLLQEYLERQ